MTLRHPTLRLAALLLLGTPLSANAGQAPFAAAAPDIPVSGQDRFYTSDQFSNTVSVINPASGTLLGVIRLGDPAPGNLSPLYRGQLLVHGMGFSPDRKTLAVVSIGSGANLLGGFDVPSSASCFRSLELDAVISIGSTLKRLGGASDAMVQ